MNSIPAQRHLRRAVTAVAAITCALAAALATGCNGMWRQQVGEPGYSSPGGSIWGSWPGLNHTGLEGDEWWQNGR